MALSKTQYNKIVTQSLKNYDKQAANGFWEIKHHNSITLCNFKAKCQKHVIIYVGLHWGRRKHALCNCPPV